MQQATRTSMNRLAGALLAVATVLSPGLALAQDHGRGEPPRQDRGPDHDRGPQDHRQADRNRGDRNDRDDRGPRNDDRGRPDDRQWQRGQRYEGPRQVVNDYRDDNLPPPPRGHRWVRDRNGDFVLIALATGIITDIILNSGR